MHAKLTWFTDSNTVYQKLSRSVNSNK